MLFEADCRRVPATAVLAGCREKPSSITDTAQRQNSGPLRLTGSSSAVSTGTGAFCWRWSSRFIAAERSSDRLAREHIQTPHKHTHLLINIRTIAGSLTHRDEETPHTHTQRERDTHRERETHTQRERERHTHTHHTHTQRERETHTHTHRERETHTHTQRERDTHTHTHSVRVTLRVREPMEKRCAHRQEVTRQTGSHLLVSSHAVEHTAGNHVQHEVAPRPETQEFTKSPHDLKRKSSRSRPMTWHTRVHEVAPRPETRVHEVAPRPETRVHEVAPRPETRVHEVAPRPETRVHEVAPRPDTQEFTKSPHDLTRKSSRSRPRPTRKSSRSRAPRSDTQEFTKSPTTWHTRVHEVAPRPETQEFTSVATCSFESSETLVQKCTMC